MWITLWFQLEDMFQLIGTPQGIEHVMFQLKDMLQGNKKYIFKYKTWMRFQLDTIQSEDITPKLVWVESILLQ